MAVQSVPIERLLDGVTFTGVLKGEILSERPELGPTVSADALHIFEGKIVQTLGRRGHCGPESFRFMRTYMEMSMTELGKLIGVTRKTIQRWEGGERQLPQAAAAVVQQLAKEFVQGSSEMADRLRAMQEAPVTTEVDVDSVAA